jgi:hypothetical protein
MPEERALVSGNDIIITGIGPLNVISKLMNLPRDTPIHNVGYAGSNSIPIGTRCRIGKVSAYHKAIFTDPKYVLDGDTPLYSSGDFVTETDITEPCLFDMELAFILAMGFTNVTAEKVVSDNLSLKEYFGTVIKG